jgi:hypothetical protein
MSQMGLGGRDPSPARTRFPARTDETLPATPRRTPLRVNIPEPPCGRTHGHALEAQR